MKIDKFYKEKISDTKYNFNFNSFFHIWFSSNEDIGINLLNKLRLLRTRYNNPDLNITLIYSSRLLSNKGKEDLENFSRICNVKLLSLETDVLQLITENSKEFIVENLKLIKEYVVKHFKNQSLATIVKPTNELFAQVVKTFKELKNDKNLSEEDYVSKLEELYRVGIEKLYQELDSYKNQESIKELKNNTRNILLKLNDYRLYKNSTSELSFFAKKKGGDLACASDIVRLIIKLLEIGNYIDLDCVLNDLNNKDLFEITSEYPLILNVFNKSRITDSGVSFTPTFNNDLLILSRLEKQNNITSEASDLSLFLQNTVINKYNYFSNELLLEAKKDILNDQYLNFIPQNALQEILGNIIYKFQEEYNVTNYYPINSFREFLNSIDNIDRLSIEGFGDENVYINETIKDRTNTVFMCIINTLYISSVKCTTGPIIIENLINHNAKKKSLEENRPFYYDINLINIVNHASLFNYQIVDNIILSKELNKSEAILKDFSWCKQGKDKITNLETDFKNQSTSLEKDIKNLPEFNKDSEAWEEFMETKHKKLIERVYGEDKTQSTSRNR